MREEVKIFFWGELFGSCLGRRGEDFLQEEGFPGGRGKFIFLSEF